MGLVSRFSLYNFSDYHIIFLIIFKNKHKRSNFTIVYNKSKPLTSVINITVQQSKEIKSFIESGKGKVVYDQVISEDKDIVLKKQELTIFENPKKILDPEIFILKCIQFINKHI